METVTTTVEIAGPTGHEALELTQDQTMALVEERGDSWVFSQGAGGMMTTQQLREADNWEALSTLRIVPGLVGGLY